LYQEQGRSLSTITKEEINDLQNTVDYQLLNEQNQELSNKGGATYVFLKEKDAEKFAYLLEKHNEFPKTFRVTSVITKYERDSKNSLKYNGYNIYKDFEYIKSNNNKKSNLYDIVDLETGEILASKVRVLHLSQDSKAKIADKVTTIKLSEIAIGIGPFVIEPAVSRKIGKVAMIEMTLQPNTWQTADWAKDKGLYADIFDSQDEVTEATTKLAEKLASYNPDALGEMKKVFWQGTENWDNLLYERAAISGKLVLSDFTKEALGQFKK
jgi:hypothetical protein